VIENELRHSHVFLFLRTIDLDRSRSSLSRVVQLGSDHGVGGQQTVMVRWVSLIRLVVVHRLFFSQ
jgi:hypothetical protein